MHNLKVVLFHERRLKWLHSGDCTEIVLLYNRLRFLGQWPVSGLSQMNTSDLVVWVFRPLYFIR
jgi:hypothetical protein